VVETKVLEEMEAQGLVSTEEGVTPAITEGASTFTDNNVTQVVLVTQNGTGKGLKAVSTTGNTVEAESTGTSGTNFTLLGINRSTGGRALFGFASATTGNTIAAAGRADSTAGIGFFGQALATSGQTVGVQSEVRSPSGIAGVFANTAGGPLLEGRSQGQVVFSVDGGGKIEADGMIAIDGLRIEPGSDIAFSDAPNLIGGAGVNSVSANVSGATIGGGGTAVASLINQVTGFFGTIGGGGDNTAGGSATVGGGESNGAEGGHATVGGGLRNTASGPESTVGGGSDNTASHARATVGGGDTNTASGISSTVGGGSENTASSTTATVGGGSSNSASKVSATVGGGTVNTASGNHATVGGGFNNTASGSAATVGGGGQSNIASGTSATIPGGRQNTAGGLDSFAAGRRAKANHDGAFVWGDSTGADVASTAVNQVTFRATGGFRIRDASSDVFVVDTGNDRVGIGTASPGFRLTLDGSGNEVYVVMSEDGTDSVDSLKFQIAPGGGTSSTRIGHLLGKFGTSFNIANLASAPLIFGVGAGPTERMRIESSGNVGIGTGASPADLLHVNGNVRLQRSRILKPPVARKVTWLTAVEATSAPGATPV
jgi:hypothetical protein